MTSSAALMTELSGTAFWLPIASHVTQSQGQIKVSFGFTDPPRSGHHAVDSALQIAGQNTDHVVARSSSSTACSLVTVG